MSSSYLPAFSPSDPTYADDPSELSGVRKAAVLLIALGVETASEVLARMDEGEVEAVSVEIARELEEQDVVSLARESTEYIS